MSIVLEQLSYAYDAGTPMESKSLIDIDLTIREGEFLGLIGHTGSGKSTLIQHLNGLLKPQSGRVLFNGQDIFGEGYDRRALRSRVGLVFQYPEYQLFETDVFTDVCFGPKNQKLPEEEIRARARYAMDIVGLGPEYDTRSPFELSGGEKRRAAIAGVLAMKPDFLILDEPTAGLDPRGREEILRCLDGLAKDGMGIVFVSHSMEDMAAYADRLAVLNGGRLVLEGTPREVFAQRALLEKIGLSVPEVTKIMALLKDRGYAVRTDVLSVEEAKKEILTLF